MGKAVPSTVAEWAAFYVASGLSPIRVRADGSKAAVDEGWRAFSERLPSRDELRQWFGGKGGRHGLGVTGGPASGNLAVLDFETRDSYERWMKVLPPELAVLTRPCPLAETGGGGRHLYVRLAEPAGSMKLARHLVAGETKTLIEVRGNGAYVVAPGSPASTHASGRPYEWLRRGWLDNPKCEPVSVHEWCSLLDVARGLNEVTEPKSKRREPKDRPPRPPGDISPGDDFNRRGTLEEAGLFEAGWKWERQDEDQRGRLTRPGKDGGVSANFGTVTTKAGDPKLWCFSSNADPFREGEGYSLFAVFATLKHKGNYEDAARALGNMGYGSPPKSAPGQHKKHQTNGHTAAAEPGAGARTQTGEAVDTSGELKGEDFEHIEPNLDVRDFVEGLLTEGGMSVVYGDSNTGKTFLVLDLSFHVAEGESWLGREVERGAVMYLAIESPESVRQRVGAYKKAKCRNGAALPWRLFPESIDLRSASVDALRVVSAAQRASEDFGVPVKLVIVDTLARAMAGGNENSPDDMGALVRNVDMIQKNTKAHVLVIHHCGKDAAKGMRGHSSLRAATDTELELTHDDAARVSTVRAAKQRDMTKGEQFSFRLEVVELGTNRRGSTVTSCVVREAVAPAKDGAEPKGDAGALLSVLESAIQTNGKPGYEGVPEGLASVPLKWVRERFYARKSGGTQDAKQKAFKRALHTLVTAGRAGESADRVWLTATGQAGQAPDMSDSSDPATGPDRPDSSL